MRLVTLPTNAANKSSVNASATPSPVIGRVEMEWRDGRVMRGHNEDQFSERKARTRAQAAHHITKPGHGLLRFYYSADGPRHTSTVSSWTIVASASLRMECRVVECQVAPLIDRYAAREQRS